MQYYLEHHFDPDFDHHHLKPAVCSADPVDHYELGYAQNVRKGSLLATWRPLEEGEVEQVDGRFVFQDKQFPMGAGTEALQETPDSLIAAEDGYVFYFQGKITVRNLLNVRSDVDFHTGNIHFLGDVAVHGSVRSGFVVEGRSIDVHQVVEAANVRARRTIHTSAGIKGGGGAVLRAKDKIMVPFCENACLITQGNTVVKHSAMHCDIYVGNNLVVGERLVGGRVFCRNVMYVGQALGGGLGETQLVLGYDPELLREDAKLDERISIVAKGLRKIRNLGRKQDQLTADEKEVRENLKAEMVNLRLCKRKLWERINSRKRLEECRVVVPGKVHPGVEISIGEAYLEVAEPMEDVVFLFNGHDIQVASPAMPNQGKL
ncbi:MAG: DUF342 domain-containing protein [Okeania sp. SIO3B3]|nr:DUF342 domain-containing protein [Okeania sp. SIO3B3]